MNILVLNGSPKGERSNTMQLTHAFLEGLGSGHSTQILELQTLTIKGCRGCFACWKATPGQCVIKDDMALVLEKLRSADLVIFSFPLYYFGVPGVMKHMIDRQLPNVLPFMEERSDGVGSGSHRARYDMSGKKYVIISTCGFWSAKGNYDAVLGMFDHICGKDNYETILCGQGELFSVPELSGRTGAYLESVRRAGAEYLSGGIREQTRAQLSELLYPKEVFEEMADASWGVSRESGECEPESLSFTRQMAALYNKDSYDGKDRVLEMCYTDLGQTYQIRLTRSGSEVITDGSLRATTRIETPWQVWKDIAAGRIGGTEALAKHLYTVKGDFSLMIRWDDFFGTHKAAPVTERTDSRLKKPLMAAMIALWMTLWIAVSIDTFIGALVTIGVCAALPLLLIRHEQTVYDKLSASLVAGAALLALGTGDGSLASDAGYLAFGLLWLVSAFTREPLCAAYVKYKYGGQKALDNPLFVSTNRILAAAWGGLYVLLAPAAFLMQHAGLTAASLIVCNAVPLLMGLFTVWFEGWYPAHVAQG
ncbi:MAG: flavodoxin family protein [Oscillospiraceae bacterium]|nr:flavodoxin family protein [Oscillospiraceae bacterium]